MKLKDKLAREYVDTLPYTESSKELISEDFIAGFEKAREMAKQKCSDAKVAPPYSEYDAQYNLGCMECECAIASLGEEEVT